MLKLNDQQMKSSIYKPLKNIKSTNVQNKAQLNETILKRV